MSFVTAPTELQSFEQNNNNNIIREEGERFTNRLPTTYINIPNYAYLSMFTYLHQHTYLHISTYLLTFDNLPTYTNLCQPTYPYQPTSTYLPTCLLTNKNKIIRPSQEYRIRSFEPCCSACTWPSPSGTRMSVKTCSRFAQRMSESTPSRCLWLTRFVHFSLMLLWLK